jgi:hypothetical protein
MSSVSSSSTIISSAYSIGTVIRSAYSIGTVIRSAYSIGTVIRSANTSNLVQSYYKDFQGLPLCSEQRVVYLDGHHQATL